MKRKIETGEDGMEDEDPGPIVVKMKTIGKRGEDPKVVATILALDQNMTEKIDSVEMKEGRKTSTGIKILD